MRRHLNTQPIKHTFKRSNGKVKCNQVIYKCSQYPAPPKILY